MKRLSKAQAAQRKRDRRKRATVATVKQGSKRKRGSSAVSHGHKRHKRLTVAANLTREDIARTLESAPDAQAHVNARGVVKQLDYKRT